MYISGMGRKPVTEPVKLPEGWEETISRIMDDGGTVAEVKNALGLTAHYHRRLMAENDEYNAAIDLGKQAAEAWWASTGKENLNSKDFKSNVWIFTMKARFGWKDTGPTENVKADEFNEEELLDKYKSKTGVSGDEKSISGIDAH